MYHITPRFNAADVLAKTITIDHAIVEVRRLMRDPEAPTWLAVWDYIGRESVVRVMAAHKRVFWVRMCPNCRGSGITTRIARVAGTSTQCSCSDLPAGWGYLEDLPCE